VTDIIKPAKILSPAEEAQAAERIKKLEVAMMQAQKDQNWVRLGELISEASKLYGVPPPALHVSDDYAEQLRARKLAKDRGDK